MSRPPWGPMARLAGRRALFAVPVLGTVTFGVFAIAAASPFDPVKAYAGTAGLSASQDTLDQLRANLGADEPLVTRWWNWLTSAVQGDLGDSSALRQPVADVIAERVGWSVLLASAAFLVAVLLGGLLGVLAARRPGGWTDRAVTSLAYTLEAAPPFWLGLLVMWLFALKLGVLPAGGLTDTGSTVVTADQVVRHLVLPAGVLALSQLPWFVLYVRQGSATHSRRTPCGAHARVDSPSAPSCWDMHFAPECCRCSRSSARVYPNSSPEHCSWRPSSAGPASPRRPSRPPPPSTSRCWPH